MKLTCTWFGAAALLAGLAGCVEPPSAVGPGEFGKIAPTDELAKRIARDPVAVLQAGIEKYDRDVKSYTCTVYKQERMKPEGPMGPQQKMICKFQEKPYSVVTDCVENPLGAKKAIYVEGQWGNKMLVQPAGLGFLLGSLLVEPRSAEARASTLQFIDQFGLKRSAEKLARSYALAHKEGIVSSKILGTGVVDGRETIVYEVHVAEPKPTGRFEFPHARVWVDREWMLPVGVDLWDAKEIERGHYRYADINFKADLTPKDFMPEANGMKSPKDVPASRPAAK